VDLVDFADRVLNLCENVVIQRVPTDDIAERTKGCKFFLNTSPACSEPNMTVMCARSWWHVNDRMPVATKSLDGGEVEGINAVNHCLVQCHAC
jgi:hypothetical protein